MHQNESPITISPHVLEALVSVRMPFGKYKNRLLCDLPGAYLVWFHQNGFPGGRLGLLLSVVYEIKLDHLEYLLKPLRKPEPPKPKRGSLLK